MFSDLEMTRLCAEAMEDIFHTTPPRWSDEGLWCFADGAPDSKGFYYDPLHDDAQAMALVKKMHLHLDQRPGKAVSVQDHAFAFISEREDGDLNRAIVECVAKMQAAKK